MLDVDGRGIYEHLFRPIIMESSLCVAVTCTNVNGQGAFPRKEVQLFVQ